MLSGMYRIPGSVASMMDLEWCVNASGEVGSWDEQIGAISNPLSTATVVSKIRTGEFTAKSVW